MEALLRLHDDELGEIGPREFIPVAEESDLMIHIGRWVFKQCCIHLREWEDQYGMTDIRISINLSEHQLMESNWCTFLAETLERYRIEASRIEFEIGEKFLSKNNKLMQRKLQRMLEMGFVFSVDDFGTAASSMTTLKKYHFQKIKIDKTFIDRIVNDPESREIVKAAITLAHLLGMESLAEGVESKAQERLLSTMGCREIQGYLFAEPIMAEEVGNYATAAFSA